MSTSRKTTKKTSATPHFEKSIDQLNALIEKMETGQLSLEASLQHFEEGIALIRHCQTALNTAEQKVQILIGNVEKDLKNA